MAAASGKELSPLLEVGKLSSSSLLSRPPVHILSLPNSCIYDERWWTMDGDSTATFNFRSAWSRNTHHDACHAWTIEPLKGRTLWSIQKEFCFRCLRPLHIEHASTNSICQRVSQRSLYVKRFCPRFLPIHSCIFIFSWNGIRSGRACATRRISVSFETRTYGFRPGVSMIFRWEWFISLDFDWQYISRQKPFHWPMVRPSAVSTRYWVLKPSADILFYEQILYATFTRGHVGHFPSSSKTVLRTFVNLVWSGWGW